MLGWSFSLLLFIELCLKNLNALSGADLIKMEEDFLIKPTGELPTYIMHISFIYLFEYNPCSNQKQSITGWHRN